MAFVCTIPLTFKMYPDSIAPDYFLSCYDNNDGLYEIKHQLLLDEYVQLTKDFYNLFKPFISSYDTIEPLVQVATYQQFESQFMQDEHFDPPSLIDIQNNKDLDIELSREFRIDIMKIWILYWCCGKLYCESLVSDSILGMLDFLVYSKFNLQLAKAMKFGLLCG